VNAGEPNKIGSGAGVWGMVVRIDKLVPKSGDPDAIGFWA